MMVRNLGGKAASAAFAVLLTAMPALADLENISWGMTPDEALAVLDGAQSHDFAADEIYLVGDIGYAPRVKLAHDLEGITGEISLLFDDADTLRFVLFNPAEIGDCGDLGDVMMGRHGEGDVLEMGPFKISKWSADGDAITLTASEESSICNLSHSEG